MRPPQAAPGPDQVEFAHLLRGLSALAVLLFHYGILFWQRPARVAELTGMPVLPAGMALWPGHAAFLQAFSLNLGAIAVGALFLISGFVLPFSFRKQVDGGGFMIGRAFRILPTYWAGFAVTLLVLWAVAAWQGHAFPHRLKDVLLHLLPGLRDMLGGANIDGIVWTLDIEMKFYLLALLIIGPLQRGSRWLLLLPAGLLLLATGWQMSGHAVPGTLLYLVFACIGIVFHQAYQRNWPWWECVLWIGLGFALWFLLAARWLHFPPNLLLSYAIAAGLFGGLYLLRAHIRLQRPTRWLADVSYPLYCVHAVLGYSGLRLMLEWQVSPLVVLPLMAGLALGLAALIHHHVELPSHHWGKRVIQRWRERTA